MPLTPRLLMDENMVKLLFKIKGLYKVRQIAIIFLLPTPRHGGGERCMYEIYTFVLSVLASIVAHFVCKWLDGE